VLSVKGSAEIRHLETRASSSLRISLVVAGVETPLAVRRFDSTDTHGEQTLVGFEIRLDRPLLAKLAETGAPGHFVVRLRSGRLRRHGKLRGQRGGSPGWPPGAWIDETSWVQPGPGADGAFVLRRMVDPCRLTAAEDTGDALVLHGRLPADLEDPQLQLTRPLSGLHQLLPVALEDDRRTFTVRIPVGPIIADTNPDDPFTQRTTRAVRMVGSDDESKLLLWTAEEQAVSHVDRGRLVALTRSTGNYVNVHESPLWLAADEAATPTGENGLQVRIGGPLTDEAAAHAFSWRRFIADSDDHLDVSCRPTIADGRWTVAVDLAELIPTDQLQNSIDPLASLADWILFAVAADGSSYAVQCEPFLSSRLPLEAEQDGITAALRPHAGTLHVEVR
jgi:CDP-glycerol glycerophosphotransferase